MRCFMNELMLISIKTKYANQIFEGTKKYEYRRKSIGEKNCNKKIYVYSSEKNKAIIGYIIVDKIIEGNAEYVLKNTDNENNSDLLAYFEGNDKCYALQIKSACKFKTPIYLNEIKSEDKNFVVPQFYRYIKKNEYIYKKLTKKEII